MNENRRELTKSRLLCDSLDTESRKQKGDFRHNCQAMRGSLIGGASGSEPEGWRFETFPRNQNESLNAYHFVGPDAGVAGLLCTEAAQGSTPWGSTISP